MRTLADGVKLGFAPTRRTVFSREEAGRFRQMTEDKLQALGVDYVGLGELNEEGLLYDPADVPKVLRQFRAAGVEALFIPHCNFGTELAVVSLARQLGVPVLLWGPRDDAPLADGRRLRDTQCGLFATGKDLRRAGVPFSYLVNCRLEDAVFERGMRNFLAAANVVRTFRTLRIGQVGTRPPAFASVVSSESVLMEKFGIEVVPVELGALLEGARQRVDSPDDGVREAREIIAASYTPGAGVDEAALNRMAALYASLTEWIDEQGLIALGFQCWSYMQQSLGVNPCFISGLLADRGIYVACETDLHGAISSALLAAAANGAEPPFFADLTIRHPSNDNAELLWHCGPFPPSLAAPEEHPTLGCNYIDPAACPGLGEFRLKDGEITIARFDGDHDEFYLLAGEGRTCEGPRVRGSYVWFEVDDWARWEEHLVRGPYIHHVSGAYGHYAPVLYEACRYLPGVQPDLVGPSAPEVESWLRGADCFDKMPE